MQINEGDLLMLKRDARIPGEVIVNAVATSVTHKDENNVECKLIINMLERRSHIFIPRTKGSTGWSKLCLVAHVYPLSRKDQKEKGLNMKNVWGDYDVIEIIKAKEQ